MRRVALIACLIGFVFLLAPPELLAGPYTVTPVEGRLALVEGKVYLFLTQVPREWWRYWCSSTYQGETPLFAFTGDGKTKTLYLTIDTNAEEPIVAYSEKKDTATKWIWKKAGRTIPAETYALSLVALGGKFDGWGLEIADQVDELRDELGETHKAYLIKLSKDPKRPLVFHVSHSSK